MATNENRRRAAYALSALVLVSFSILFSVHPAAADDGKYRLPFASGKSYTVTQLGSCSPSHCGALKHAIDFGLPSNTPVLSANGGKVWWINKNANNGYGIFVEIKHRDGKCTRYAHLDSVKDGLATGQFVQSGKEIGRSGNTGTFTTGAHLHFHRQECLTADQLKVFAAPTTLATSFVEGGLTEGKASPVSKNTNRRVGGLDISAWCRSKYNDSRLVGYASSNEAASWSCSFIASNGIRIWIGPVDYNAVCRSQYAPVNGKQSYAYAVYNYKTAWMCFR